MHFSRTASQTFNKITQTKVAEFILEMNKDVDIKILCFFFWQKLQNPCLESNVQNHAKN